MFDKVPVNSSNSKTLFSFTRTSDGDDGTRFSTNQRSKRSMKHTDSLLADQNIMTIKPDVNQWDVSDVLAWITTLALPIDQSEVCA